VAKVSDTGLAHLRSFEGLSLDAYPDGGGWSIGYGHHGNDVYPGMQITQQRADQLLKNDIERFDKSVQLLFQAAEEQEEFDAKTCLAYNIGINAFKDSTLLEHVNAGRHHEAADEFKKWIKSGDEVLPGLIKRRDKEAAMYKKGGRAG